MIGRPLTHRIPLGTAPSGAVLAAVLLFVVLSSAPTAAQDIIGLRPDLAELLTDDREEWRVAVLRFTGIDLDVENEYLTSSVPRLLREDIGDIEAHRLSAETIRGYRSWLIEEAELELGRRLTRARDERDELLFDRLEPSEYRSRYREESAEIEEIAQLLEELSTIEPNQIPVARVKPVAFVAEELAATEDVSEFVVEEDIDLAVYGTIEQIEEYVYVEFFAWDRFQGEELSLGATAARPEEIYLASADIQAAVAGAILGRDWAHLRVEAPASAAVSVNGVLRGIGTVDVRYLPPGDASIEVTAPGRVGVERRIALLPFRTVGITVELEEVGVEEILVTSEPRDADVYVQSVWRGRTPVALPRPTFPTDVTIVADGHRDDAFILSPQSPDRIERIMVPQDRDWNAYIQNRRDTFYWSLGAFALSVPIPVVFGSLYDDAAAQFEAYESEAPLEELNELARRGNTYLYTRRTGIVVTVALLANTVWQLTRYIRAAQYQPE